MPSRKPSNIYSEADLWARWAALSLYFSLKYLSLEHPSELPGFQRPGLPLNLCLHSPLRDQYFLITNCCAFEMTITVTFSPEIEPVVWFNWTGGVYLGAFWFTRVCVYTFLGESLLSGTFFPCVETLYQSSSGTLCRSWDCDKLLPAVQKSLLLLIVQYSTEIVLSSSFFFFFPCAALI